ncbi:hypothetical protein BDW42DRAFT_168409 [Aspergillus taichungensis]|uniref:Uncharacterized protein n=1 Tax=Aspergillus taichungensis TaxID=482145 RepID=A0A2J5HWE0_9EURO|nr:hypothetical protein BDW42DRAFT_168409 [Aspergillus taichungensis]
MHNFQPGNTQLLNILSQLTQNKLVKAYAVRYMESTRSLQVAQIRLHSCSMRQLSG